MSQAEQRTESSSYLSSASRFRVLDVVLSSVSLLSGQTVHPLTPAERLLTSQRDFEKANKTSTKNVSWTTVDRDRDSMILYSREDSLPVPRTEIVL